MDAALIALTERGARFTFLGDPFRSRAEISNEDVVDFDFSQIELTDADAEALLPLVHLEGISFWNTRISDRTIELLTHFPRLARLNLCGTGVTDASVPVLAGMPLSYLDVAETLVTDDGVQMLRAELPEAEILF
jgi:hypothetical protein